MTSESPEPAAGRLATGVREKNIKIDPLSPFVSFPLREIDLKPVFTRQHNTVL